MKNGQKKLYIEFIRIAACFCVIFTHTMERGYFLFSVFPQSSLQYWLYMMLSVFCKAAVPMFFTISGALLLKKEETLKDLYQKRVLKMIAVLVLFSFLYYLRSIIDNLGAFSLKLFVNDLLISNWNFTYWYLYAFIIFLVSVPFLRILAKNMKKEHFYYLFLLGMIFKAAVPITEYLVWQGSEALNGSIRSIWTVSDIVIYPMLGYFLETQVEIKNIKKWLFPLWIVNIVLILVTCILTCYQTSITGVCEESRSQTFFNCFTLWNITTIFISVKYLFEKREIFKWQEKCLLSLGGASFGIYLVHLLFLNLFPVVPRMWPILDGIFGENAMLSALIVCLAVMGMSYVAALILKKIPVFRKLI